MLRSLGIVSAVLALTLALPGAAFANESNARSYCHIVDKSGGFLSGSVNITNAPPGTRALATAYFAAGQNFSLNGVLFAPGTPVGVPASKEFDPNDPVDELSLQAPFATQATGQLLVIIESASVYWPKTGETEWMQKGPKSFATDVSCEILTDTVTNTVTVTQTNTVTVPVPVSVPVEVPVEHTRTIFVHTDSRTPWLRVHKSLRSRLAAGQNADYVVEACNIGNGDAHGVVVTDSLPGQLTFRDTSGGTLIGGKLVWKISRIRAGTCWTHPVHTRVDRNTGGRKGVCNQVTVTARDVKPATFRRCDNVAVSKVPRKNSDSTG